jgi:integrase
MKRSNIWYFEINDEGDRQVKNEQSLRRVPVHPEVQALGFLEYVETSAPDPDDLLFPELRPGGPDNKLGYYFTKWWSRYRRDVGVYEKGLDYHSFRHSVTTKLYEAEVSPAIIDELTGLEGEGTSQVVYKKNMSLKVLYKAISKVKWPEVVLKR